MTVGTIVYGDERIPYQVNVDPKRTSQIAIHVDPDGSVIVDAPPNQSDDVIQKAVQKRARWIVEHVADARDRFKHVRPKAYVSGEEVLYLGRRYMLKVVVDPKSKGKAKLIGNRLEVTSKTNDPDRIRGITRAWYRAKARDYFARMIDEQSKRLPWVQYSPPFRMLDMNRQWGSCSITGDIILNPHLIKAPRDCVRYVIIHELAHLKHHDHSPEFFDLVSRHAPGWEQPKALLDSMVEVLALE